MTYWVSTLAQEPRFRPEIDRLNAETWPPFMLHDAVANRYWSRLYTDLPQFQFVLCNERDEVVAAGNCIPVFWDGTTEGLPAGFDGVLERGFQNDESGRVFNVLSALLATVSRAHQGQGISVEVLEAMKTLAAEHGLGALIAPVRPTLKSRYPLTPMERYVHWERKDRLPFDPWLRVHRRIGAEFLGVARRSMLIAGTVGEWEEWTGMQFPESGP